MSEPTHSESCESAAERAQIEREMLVTKKIHEVLLCLPKDRRGLIIKAVCILLNIYIPGE